VTQPQLEARAPGAQRHARQRVDRRDVGREAIRVVDEHAEIGGHVQRRTDRAPQTHRRRPSTDEFLNTRRSYEP
jgi:hypothetical protein